MTLISATIASNILVGTTVTDSQEALNVMVLCIKSQDYNLLVAKNTMKWNQLLVNPDILDEYNFIFSDNMINKARTVGSKVRSHVLIRSRGKCKIILNIKEIEVSS